MKHVHLSADHNNLYKTCAPAAGSPVQANIGRTSNEGPSTFVWNFRHRLD